MNTKTTLTLSVAWRKRAKLWAEGAKLWAEAAKLRAEGSKLWAEGDKLWAERAKLQAEGDKLWAEAIIEKFGNIKLEWKWISERENHCCILENGEVYELE